MGSPGVGCGSVARVSSGVERGRRTRATVRVEPSPPTIDSRTGVHSPSVRLRHRIRMTASVTRTGVVHLAERAPQLAGAEMVAALVPPPQFADATFDTYRADPSYPSQQQAKDLLQAFSGASAPVKGGLFRRAKRPELKPGIYLDGGFG